MAVAYESYVFWAAFNSFLIYLKVMLFMSFSKRISGLMTVVARAKLSLFFFAVLFMLVNRLTTRG